MLLKSPGLPKTALRKWLKMNVRPFRRIAEKRNASAESLVKIRLRRKPEYRRQVISSLANFET
jgi:hypothetical protein